MAIGQALYMDDGGNPLKAFGSKDYHHPIKVMLDGWKKGDLHTIKQLPIEVNIPEYLVQIAMKTKAGEGQKAIAELTLIDLCYLLRVEEHTCRRRGNDEK